MKVVGGQQSIPEREGEGARGSGKENRKEKGHQPPELPQNSGPPTLLALCPVGQGGDMRSSSAGNLPRVRRHARGPGLPADLFSEDSEIEKEGELLRKPRPQGTGKRPGLPSSLGCSWGARALGFPLPSLRVHLSNHLREGEGRGGEKKREGRWFHFSSMLVSGRTMAV